MKHVSSGEVLFLSHKANRSGAPSVLLGIVSEFKTHSQAKVRVLLMEDGPLVAEFRKLAPTYLWVPRTIGIPGLREKNPVTAFFSRLYTILNGLWILWQVRKTTLVFSNTITNGHIHKKLLYLKPRFITYVHELEVSIHALTNEMTLNTVLNHTDLFIACSLAVKNNLVQNHAVDPAKVEVVYASIPETTRDKNGFLKALEPLKKELKITEHSIVFGAVGENEWRKGFDLFAPLTLLYFSLYPQSNAHFVWMGVRKERISYFDDIHDFNHYELSDRAHLILHTTDYLQNMSLFDVYLLLSREDPFPLVVLDAASFSIPTICFEDGGGAPELISTDGGICVPYGNLFAMAEALHKLETNESDRRRLGQTVHKKLQSGYSASASTRRIVSQIDLLSKMQSGKAFNNKQ